MNHLNKIIDVDEEKCVNCQACIAVCPVKFCIDASGDYVKNNDDMCIGCGACIEACSHEARTVIDDFDQFKEALERGENVVAIVAPAVAANFKNSYLQINGWLKSMGVESLFDVSFGAELTVKSYLEYAKQFNPKCIIAQPCPAIVTFIEIYHPELLKYLAPADSPMMHAMKMIKEFYPKYKNHKIAIISPCIAKRREFDEVGIGDFNVTFLSLKKYLDENKIDLSQFDEVEFDNPPAERAVLFSSPGGLMRTVERESEVVSKATRKIEGNPAIYEYLEELDSSIDKGYAPVLVDCLNCEKGCNGGTGTFSKDSHPDEIEYFVEKRNREMQDRYKINGIAGQKRTKKKIEKTINKYWKEGLYNRTYENLSDLNGIKMPTEQEIQNIYTKMNKFSDEDLYNCNSCGYGSCRKMAIAIYNGLNKPENCHHYIISKQEEEHNKVLSAQDEVFALEKNLKKQISERKTIINELVASLKEVNTAVDQIKETVFNSSEFSQNVKNLTSNTNNDLDDVLNFAESVNGSTQNVNRAIDEMNQSIKEIAENTRVQTEISEEAEKRIKNTSSVINRLEDSAKNITKVINLINDIADQTNMLALNATIEAASAGEAGKGFSVVASEVKELAKQTSAASEDSLKNINNMLDYIKKTVDESQDTAKTIKELNSINATIASAVTEQSSVAEDVRNQMVNTKDSLDNFLSMINKISENINKINQTSDKLDRLMIDASRTVEESADKGNEIFMGLQQLQSE